MLAEHTFRLQFERLGHPSWEELLNLTTLKVES